MFGAKKSFINAAWTFQLHLPPHGDTIIPLKDALLRDTQMVILNQKEIPPHVRSFYHYVKTQNLA